MYDDDLIDRVLIYPVRNQGCRTLCIVTGYADPSLLNTHLDDWLAEHEVHVKLIIGMFPEQKWGSQSNDPARREVFWISLRGFRSKALYVNDSGSTYECRYVIKPPRIHTKLYIWLDDQDNPRRAFIGSPNYTQKAFTESKQANIVTADGDIDECYAYFQRHWSRGLDCNAFEIEEKLDALRNR